MKPRHQQPALADTPPRSPWVWTEPDPDGGYIARRWGQPHPVGRGAEEIDAVNDLHDREEAPSRDRAA